MKINLFLILLLPLINPVKGERHLTSKSLIFINMFNENNHTLKEILQQPSVWMKTYELVLSQKKALSEYFKQQGITKDSDIILTFKA